MTKTKKVYHDYVDKLREEISKDGQTFTNETIADYISSTYDKAREEMVKARKQYVPMLYFLVGNLMEETLKERGRFIHRDILKTWIHERLEKLFILPLSEEWDKQPPEYRHVNSVIFYSDIREVVDKLAREYYPKLTSERKQELQDGLKRHREYKKNLFRR